MTEANTSCKYCGSPLTPGMRFCGACGKPVSGPENAYSAEPAASQADDLEIPGSTASSVDPVSPVWNTAPSAQVDQAAPNKKNRYLIPGLLVGALILCGCLCLAGLAIFSFVSGNTLRAITNRSETIQ